MSDLLELVKECEKASDIVEDMVKIKAMGDKAKRLYDLGLVQVAQGIMDEADLKLRMKRVAEGGYIRITDAKIKAFLERKAAEYNKGRKKYGHMREEFTSTSVESVYAALAEQQRRLAEQEMRSYADYQRYISIPQSMFQVNSWQMSWATDTTEQPRAFTGSTLEALTVDSHSTAPNTIGRFRWVEVPVSQYKGIPPEPVLAKLAEEKVKGIFQEYHIASVENIHDPLLLGIVKGCADKFYLAQWGEDVSLDDVI